jgi:hypothetical protein
MILIADKIDLINKEPYSARPVHDADPPVARKERNFRHKNPTNRVDLLQAHHQDHCKEKA